MRIVNSNITMAAGRHYTQQGQGYDTRKRTASVVNDVFSRIASNAGESGVSRNPASSAEALSSRTEEAGGGTKGVGGGGTKGVGGTGIAAGDLRSELIAIRDSLLQELIKRMLSSGLFGGINGSFGTFGLAAGFHAPGITGGMTGISGTGTGVSSRGLTFTRMNYGESETTAFLAHGLAQTEDGRTMDFDVSVLMSRSFMQYTQINVPLFSDALFDPLVINTGSAVASLSDKTFRFDLDMDGEEDNISMPENGSGFLALDLNGDGVINDGSELFGVKSGNGFADLAAYDTDGNGWIDENDDIFSKLKVWYRNGDGTDELTDLKTADVGAIYLGHQTTDFAMYGSAFQLNGMVRATGLFLRESGSVGTVQHIDLAKQREEAPDVNAGSFPDMPDGVPVSDARVAGGAPVIRSGEGTRTERSGQEKDSSQTMQRTDQDGTGTEETKSRNDTRAERAKRRAEAEAAREQARTKRRAEKEALDKAAAERLQERKELLREQLEALFEERETQKEQYDGLLANRRKEHDALHAQLLNTEQVDAMLEGQKMVI